MKKKYPEVTQVSTDITLEYVSMGQDNPPKVYRNFPVPPAYMPELTVAIRPFDPDIEDRFYNARQHGKPQIILEGSARALEDLGRYLIALARLKTENPAPNAHFDEIQNDDGGTIHLIVRRSSS